MGAERETRSASQSTVDETRVPCGSLVGFRGIEQRRLRGIPLTLDLGGFSQSPVLLSGEGDLSAWIRVRSRYMLRLGMTEAFRRKREYLMKETRCDELHTTWRVQSPGQDVQQYK